MKKTINDPVHAADVIAATLVDAPRCVSCGSTKGYEVNDHVQGWRKSRGTWDGTEVPVDRDVGLLNRYTLHVACLQCGHKQPRPARP